MHGKRRNWFYLIKFLETIESRKSFCDGGFSTYGKLNESFGTKRSQVQILAPRVINGSLDAPPFEPCEQPPPKMNPIPMKRLGSRHENRAS